MKNITVLVVNAGSSSIKLALFAVESDQKKVLLSASVSGIGQSHATLSVKRDEHAGETIPIAADYEGATEAVTSWLSRQPEAQAIDAVGHRFVHGGFAYHGPTALTDEVVAVLQELAVDDPEHTPQALHFLAVLRQTFPAATHFASFDTAFFATIPAVAQLIPIPQQYRDLGVRRYGFHGLSYSYLQRRFQEIAGDKAVRGRVIYAHLGGGASLAATKDGKPVDMTMGLTPASGVAMSTRPGDIDPGLPFYLHRKTGLSLEDFQTMVNHDSGLKAVSGLSADMYTLIQSEAQDPQAALAVEYFCYKIRQAIGSLSATLGGLDSLVFSGGIGEQSSVLRARICQDLGYLGIRIDPDTNDQHLELISSPVSTVGVHVIPTNEADTILTETIELYRNTEG